MKASRIHILALISVATPGVLAFYAPVARSPMLHRRVSNSHPQFGRARAAPAASRVLSTGRTAAPTATAEKAVFWDGQRLHDYFNLAVIPALIALSVAGIMHTPYNLPLAIIMFSYIAVDGLWIALQPHIVGSPATLIGHHLATLLVVGHAMTCAPHIRFVSWMTIVEVNTFFLILKRHVAHPLIELAFQVSWAAIRIVWFPIVAVFFSFFIDWPTSLIRRLSVSGCVSGLALLQLQWSWNAIIAPMLKKGKEEAEPSSEADGGKDGFL